MDVSDENGSHNVNLNSRLQFKHSGINAFLLYKRDMISVLHDLAIFDHDDSVCFLDRLEPMGDNDYRATGKERVERLGNFFLRERVKRGSRFVEQDDLRVLKKNLRNSKALSLASGETDSFFPDFRFHAVREIKYEIAFCHFECLLHFFI